MDGKKRYDGSTEALRCQNPCSVVGFAVMLIDAWLFASGVTVNTKKNTRKKKTTMKANEMQSQFSQ